MSNIIIAKITLEDEEAAQEILKVLKAPVNKENIHNLRELISELGEMYEAGYNKMLVEMTNDKLVTYNTKCDCGRRVQVSLTKADFDNAITV